MVVWVDGLRLSDTDSENLPRYHDNTVHTVHHYTYDYEYDENRATFCIKNKVGGNSPIH